MLKHLLFIGQILITSIVYSQVHYVSPTGNGTWNEALNINTPCSIYAVNNNVSAGDTVYFRGGTYTNTLNPDGGSGTPTNPMAFINYANETPIIDVQGAYNYCIDLRDANYTLVQGITVKNPSTNYAIVASGHYNPPAHDITIKDCTSINGGIIADETDGFNVLNCNVENPNGVSIVIYGSEFNKITNTRIENCTITNSGNDAITLHANSSGHSIGNYHIIRGNTVNGVQSENCYDLTSGNYIIFENNVCSGCNGPGISAGHLTNWIRIKNYTSFENSSGSEHIYLGGEDMSNISVLNSVFYGSAENAIKIYSSYTPGNNNFRIFNNTIDGRNIDDRSLIQIDENTENLSFKNNILYFDDDGVGMDWEINPSDSDMYSNSNLYWHTSQSPNYNDIWFQNENLSYICNTYDRECNGLEMNPLFTDETNHNYTLQTASPAIDNGEWLTFITSPNGSGTSFFVGDALWFYDGWNIAGETGDTIKTESGQTAVITSIDYNTNTITVNQSITWTQNEGLALSYKGTKPDIGAFEYDNSVSVDENICKEFKVYPNPTSRKVFISNKYLGGDYHIISMDGRLVKSGRINTNTINITKLKSGIFILQIRDCKTNKMNTFKIIKE